jgi:phospholipase/carboxylesterase
MYSIEKDGWVVRVQKPRDNQPPRSMLMIHGWTGDETVMWVFAHKVPANYWLFAPRGPIAAEDKYGWLPHNGGWPKLADFAEVARALMNAFEQWAGDARAPHETFDVMGFSQGAAMAYALAAYYPQRVRSVLALAGFLPPDEDGAGQSRYLGFKGKPVYIAHGTKDETVPVSMAREAAQTLQAAGAQVRYCESEAGHKLSAACLRGLEDFLR